MNRIRAALTALLAAAILLGGAGVASADEEKPPPQTCEFEVPEVPGECLTEAVYAYLVDLQDERYDAQARAAHWQNEAGVYQELYESNRDALEYAGTQWQWWQEKAVRQDQKITILRAKVKDLRQTIRDLT